MKVIVAVAILAIIVGLFTSSAMAMKEKDQQQLAHGSKLRKSNPFVDVIQSIFGGGSGDGDEEESYGYYDDEYGYYDDNEDQGLSLRKIVRMKANVKKSAHTFKNKMIKAVNQVADENSSSGDDYNDCITNHTLVYTEPCDYTQQCVDVINDCLPYAGEFQPLIIDSFCSEQNSFFYQYCKIDIPFCNNGTSTETSYPDGDDQDGDDQDGDDQDGYETRYQ